MNEGRWRPKAWTPVLAERERIGTFDIWPASTRSQPEGSRGAQAGEGSGAQLLAWSKEITFSGERAGPASRYQSVPAAGAPAGDGAARRHSAAAIVVFPTPPLPITLMSPWPSLSSASTSIANGSARSGSCVTAARTGA